ncbi:MAG: peptidoglycan -binding protein [Rhodospirillales bacterium]|nr:peptidoglycan -binding protein [Rhodospirillales bacterium]
MASIARRSQRATNIWPGFVDALATLLMVIIFLLMVFVLAQFFLSEAISGRDQTLQRLQNQISELGNLLSLERKANTDLRVNVTQLSEELQASVNRGDELTTTVRSLTRDLDAAKQVAMDLQETIRADAKTIEAKVREVLSLSQQTSALQALKEELESKIAGMAGKLQESETTLIAEKKLSESARAQIALMNKQMAALRDQLAQLSEALDASERKAKEQGVKITSLGKRLNAALASKVQELTQYRSEFFGRLRELLGNRSGVRVVGDRFVFQSEVLFQSGSAELGVGGKKQLDQLAETLIEIAATIPKDINWILRVDGHTDPIPIRTALYRSNWDLSAARAISVVNFLIAKGLPPQRLAAAGFGEFQPIDPRRDEIANRRNRRIEFKLTQR